MTTLFYVLSDVNSCLLTASPPQTPLEPRVQVTPLLRPSRGVKSTPLRWPGHVNPP